MSTIIYLGNKIVQILEGTSGAKLTVSKNLTLKAPEGTIINGIVMDQETFTEFIKNEFTKHSVSAKEVTLVINTSKFVGQSIDIPKMSDKAVLGYIRREFADIDQNSDRVYGFVRLGDGDKGLTRIYSESVSPEFLKDYIELFGSMGIKLKSIYSAESNLINLISKSSAKKYSDFMLLIAGSMTLTTILFSEGKFIYYNSSRCFHEPGTDEFASDLARSVSQIGQFMKANQIEKETSHIFLAGINRDDLPMYKEAIGQGRNADIVKVFEFDQLGYMADRDAQHFLFALGGLYGAGGSDDYLRQMKARRDNKGPNVRWRYIMPTLITAVVMAIVLLVSVMFSTSTGIELDQLKSQNEHSQTKDMYNEALEKNINLVSDYVNVGEANENLATYPVPGTKTISAIKRHAVAVDMSIVSYNGENGQLEVNLVADSSQSISDCISELKREALVYDVIYTGFSFVEERGYYTSKIYIVLAESAGRE